MRTDADSVQTNCSAVGEASRTLAGRAHRIPPRRPRASLPAYQRSKWYRGLRSSARFGLLVLALGDASNTSTDHGSRRSQEWRRHASCALLPAWGTRELTVCPSLACTLLPYSDAAKERAPAMPCHPCRWAGLAPNCARAQS
jgi:hypothetical protein